MDDPSPPSAGFGRGGGTLDGVDDPSAAACGLGGGVDFGADDSGAAALRVAPGRGGGVRPTAGDARGGAGELPGTESFILSPFASAAPGY